MASTLSRQLGTRHARPTQKVLQDICQLYRTGHRFLPDQLYNIENQTIGLTFSSADPKVRRWALNAIAQFGRPEHCRSAVMHALATYHYDPEVLAAAIAAFYHIDTNASLELRKFGFDQRMMTLAALQHVPASSLDLSALPIRVDLADEEQLKLGLLVVGLGKAPENMFEPNHDNAAIVRVLGSHHDPIVSQYSIWAITENINLNIDHLGIDIKNVEQMLPNIRAWVFQLLAMDAANSNRYTEYVKLGIADESVEARVGLSVGLRNIFSESLAPMVIEWFAVEDDQQVRQNLADHLLRQSDRHEPYRRWAIQELETAIPGSQTRERMLAIVAGTPMYSALRRVEIAGNPDLFGGGYHVDNRKTINIAGSVQAGAVAFDGNADNSGISNFYNSQNSRDDTIVPEQGGGRNQSECCKRYGGEEGSFGCDSCRKGRADARPSVPRRRCHGKC